MITWDDLWGAEARWLDDVPDALTAEAMAAKEGVELALERGLDKCILEVDSQGLAKLLVDPSRQDRTSAVCVLISQS